MSAQVLRFPIGRMPLGYDELVAQLDKAVDERRARPGTIYLLLGTPGSKHARAVKRDSRGRAQAPSLDRLRAELAKCTPAAEAPKETP